MVNLAETLLDWSIYLKCTHLWHPIDCQGFLSAIYENWNKHDYKLFIKKRKNWWINRSWPLKVSLSLYCLISTDCPGHHQKDKPITNLALQILLIQKYFHEIFWFMCIDQCSLVILPISRDILKSPYTYIVIV